MYSRSYLCCSNAHLRNGLTEMRKKYFVDYRISDIDFLDGDLRSGQALWIIMCHVNTKIMCNLRRQGTMKPRQCGWQIQWLEWLVVASCDRDVTVIFTHDCTLPTRVDVLGRGLNRAVCSSTDHER